MGQTKKVQPEKVKNGKNKTLKKRKNKTLKRTSKPKQTKGGNITRANIMSIRQRRINRLERKLKENEQPSESDKKKLNNLIALQQRDTELNEIDTHIEEIRNDKKIAIEWFIRFIGEWYNIGDILHELNGSKEKSRLNNADGTYFCIFNYTDDVYTGDNRGKVIEDFEKISSPRDKWEVWTDDHINKFIKNIDKYKSPNSLSGLTMMHTNGANWLDTSIDKISSFTRPIEYTTEKIIEKIRNGELEKDTIITRPNSWWNIPFIKDKCKSYNENQKKFLKNSHMDMGGVTTGREYFESHKEKRDKLGIEGISDLNSMKIFNPEKLRKNFPMDVNELYLKAIEINKNRVVL